MAFPDRYRINSPLVTGEAIDGEVVIIHLDNGNYYSLLEVGERIWQHLVAGKRLEDIVRELTTSYTCDETRARQSLERLVAELLAEELIVPRESEGADLELGPAMSVAAAPPERRPFVEPVLQKYTDMQSLLMVDPIHEVTDQGWPLQSGAGAPSGRSQP